MADETFHLNRQTDSDNPMDVGQALDQFMNKRTYTPVTRRFKKMFCRAWYQSLF